jgi:autophagy-related protein 11
MLYAYGATVIEIVRRKEFGKLVHKLVCPERFSLRRPARFFYQRAQSILEVMAKLS